MNINTGIYLDRNSTVLTIFYTRVNYVDDPLNLTKIPTAGDPKCEMFKTGYIKKISLFETGITFKFEEECTGSKVIGQKDYRTFKLHLNPERLKDQIYTLADVIEKCGLSGLRVVEYFSKILSDINLQEYEKK